MEGFVGNIIDYFDEESPEASEFRRLYSKLKNLYSGQTLKNILVTSATINEGKSTTAALLACTIARYRETKTILVDCDLRRPRVHQLFEMRKEHGLADVLAGKKRLDSCFKSSPIENLKILTSGGIIDNPTELFNSSRLKEMFQEIKFYFDAVIVDSPPVNPVTDALILAPEMDGAIMVIKAGQTPREVVRRATELMRSSGLNILGAIVNNQKGVLPYFYDHSYYGYKYYSKNNKKEATA